MQSVNCDIYLNSLIDLFCSFTGDTFSKYVCCVCMTFYICICTYIYNTSMHKILAILIDMIASL